VQREQWALTAQAAPSTTNGLSRGSAVCGKQESAPIKNHNLSYGEHDAHGDFLLRMLLKLQTLLHEDGEESYYQQSAQTETECAGAEALSPLKEWLGTFGLSGQTF
jgi:hypothetical protein